jgi:hypothetical protein
MNDFFTRSRALIPLCCLFATTNLLAGAGSPATHPDTARVELITQGSHASLRGLSVVNDKVLWVSGSNGAVGRSIDAGKTWTWIIVPGYEKRDFRDIEAFDTKTAVIMAVDTPADILKTTDGGKTWRLVYENKTLGMFLDAMEFWNVRSGIVVGDPINGRFFVARSFDGGDSWHEIPTLELPQADSAEGCFAASGTNVRALDLNSSCFVSGGLHSRLFIRDRIVDLPIIQGTASTGANSIAVKDHNKQKGGRQLIVVGGDFAKDTARDRNCFLSNDGAQTWTSPQTPPHGYRSCVEYIGDHAVLCCGTSGVDISYDDGMNWHLLTHTGFHVCRLAKKGNAVYLAGPTGRIAKLAL